MEKFYKKKVFYISLLILLSCIFIMFFPRVVGATKIVALGILLLFIKSEKIKIINNKFRVLTSIFIVLLMSFNILNIIVISENGQLKLFVKKEKHEELKNVNENIIKIYINNEKEEVKNKGKMQIYNDTENSIEEDNKKDMIQLAQGNKHAGDKVVSSYNVIRDNTNDCKEGQVVITMEGKKYHKPNCGSIKHVKEYATSDEAEKMGYSPCRKCYPC